MEKSFGFPDFYRRLASHLGDGKINRRAKVRRCDHTWVIDVDIHEDTLRTGLEPLEFVVALFLSPLQNGQGISPTNFHGVIGDAIIRPVRRAFTLIELVVVMAIISILMAILLPAIEHVRHQAYIDKCAGNLLSIGQALSIYANENHGSFPRTVYVPGSTIVFGTNSDAPDPFLAGGPLANDVTAAIFLLMRSEKMPPATFICPYDDVFDYQTEPGDIDDRSNFTNEKVNLGYSFADPYPDTPAVNAGYKWNASVSADFAVASDKNPGTDAPHDDVINISPTSAQDTLDKGNSGNHEKDGQNVLFGDGHVSWERTPFCGVNGDNIFTNQNNVLTASPVTKDDSLLLPTDD